jgi:hypothetical protein
MTEKDVSTTPGHLPLTATFEEASKYGVHGRLVWAVANLGRDPLISRVIGKAATGRELTSTLRNGLRELCSMGILQLVGSNRVRFALNNPHATFMVKCRTCNAKAPERKGKDAARGAAIEAGWVFAEGPQGETLAFCPECSLVKPKGPLEAAQGSPQEAKPATETRQARRKRQRLLTKRRRS